MKIEFILNGKQLALDRKTTVAQVISQFGPAVDEGSDHAERRADFVIGGVTVRLVWSRRSFFGRQFERLARVYRVA